MLLLIGGMLVFKFSQREAPAAPVPVSSSSSTASVPASPPPPPPPPPPPSALDASADAAAVPAKTPQAKRAVGGCAGECDGRETAPLTSALRAKAGQARGCYERALRQNSMLEGKVNVQVRVGSEGQVCSASVTSDSVRDPAVTSCILQLFRSGRFPPPSHGCLDVNVPMSFVPKS
ncbi:MAG: AgmX/PglI C-terminal domain-containing protein [Verrucomicrobia bacterium]|nr:AgmX/PglI C-terminal domain-containing protein [Verrucomicrobiota bacterium]